MAASNSIYQRIPPNFLAPIVGKIPMNLVALLLPPKRSDPDYATWGAADFATTPFEQISRTAGPKRFRDVSWARWNAIELPAHATLEQALDAVEMHNNKLKRLIKIRLTFRDGCHLLFERANWADPDTLVCKEYRSPHATSEAALKPAAPHDLSFVASENGHLTRRRRDHNGNPARSSFASVSLPPIHTAATTLRQPGKTVHSTGFPPDQPGHVGFDFTPVGTNSRAVRHSRLIEGVRPRMNETSPAAFQTLRPRDPEGQAFSYGGGSAYASWGSPGTLARLGLSGSRGSGGRQESSLPPQMDTFVERAAE
eukprot:TRINITY_DN2511_c0_g1_i1.p1 TRINITY_DN2511_c0_g1~~TRINITY_DN2511_c0_g1_i1.p1  ORF type:complete len:311 (+),score=38.40 TRINITY_DN2511_c0_g1_i1:259-1191(+)